MQFICMQFTAVHSWTPWHSISFVIVILLFLPLVGVPEGIKKVINNERS